jgi:pimeloyl-ACP methyl ester carboxylesterase
VRVSLESTAVRDIPVLTLAPDDAACCPVVFFVPGFGGAKEAGLSIGYRLARHGVFVVSVDPWLHGDRHDPRRDRASDPELGGIYPPESGLDTGVVFYRIIGRCLEDVRTLLAHFADDPRCDVSRCGVTGLSMGGYASFLVFAELPQMVAAVPMIGISSFARRWQDLLDECAFSNPVWADALRHVKAQTADHTAFVRQIDPVEKLKTAAPRALHMMSCDFDSDQPKHYSIACYRDLLPAYAGREDRLRLSIYPAGHTVTPEMECDAVAWFCEHLV